MTERERRFAERAIGRKRVFLFLSGLNVFVGLALAAHLGWRSSTYAEGTVGLHAIIIVLVLLNGRQALRQFRYAGILEKLTGAGAAKPSQTGAP